MRTRTRLLRNTAQEEATIQRGIASDPDTFELFDAATLSSARTTLPPATYAALVRRRGPQKAATKEPISLRLDRDLLDRLRASGPGWQRRANDLLRKAVFE